jgi:hypothetical protein
MSDNASQQLAGKKPATCRRTSAGKQVNGAGRAAHMRLQVIEQ